jgi:hypothetical protein
MKKNNESLKTDTSTATPKVSKITKLFIVILFLSLPTGILSVIGSWQAKADKATFDKATAASKSSQDDEDSPEDKAAKAEFDTFIISNAKIGGRAMVARAQVSHDRLVRIEVTEPKTFAALADDQFKELSRFIALSYGKLMGKYIAKKMEERKESETTVDFWYFNVSDESLPLILLPIAASRYTYIKREGKKGDVVGEKLKPPSICIAEYAQEKSVRKAMESAKEKFRYKVLEGYELHGYPMFKEVSFQSGCISMKFMVYNSNDFDKLSKNKIKALFEALALDHAEIIGPYIKFYMEREVAPFEQHWIKEQIVLFDIYLIRQRGEYIHNDLSYSASYYITKDGATSVRCQYYDGQWNVID